MALVGLMQTLSIEGAKDGIKVNCLAPTAATRMTEGLMPQAVLDRLAPEAVTAGLLFLVGEDAPTRTILCAGAGAFAVAQIIETQGAFFPEGERTPEAIAARFAEIADPAGAEALAGALQQTDKFVHMAAEAEGISLGAGNQEKAP
jgi:NAD(P)-dependent dehydrogenase (short-subunit alcohol dehydrogenase family)